jgi:ubiquinone/menaquinone biosynthesis C-methylase UbiE
MNETSYQQDQKELHKKLAKFYQKRYGHKCALMFQEFWNKEILALCPPSNNSPVVDLGCGTGIFFPALSKKYKSVVGIDLSLDMIINAPRDIYQVKGCIVGDGTSLPLHDKSVFTVICRSALHHLPNLDQTLLEIRRILKNNGVFVFSEPSNDNYFIRVSRLLMYKLSSRFDERDVAFITSNLVERLERLKFKVDKIKRFGFFSYCFCGFPDHFPVMIYIPFNTRITRILISIDKLASKIPIIRSQSCHVIFRVTKE